MKKLLLTLSIVSLLMACDSETVDMSLPETDISLYKSGNTVNFPKGTKALDVYNTVISIYSDNEYHDITNGEWKYIKTENTDGLVNQTWEAVSFNKVKHTLTKY